MNDGILLALKCDKANWKCVKNNKKIQIYLGPEHGINKVSQGRIVGYINHEKRIIRGIV